MSSLYGVTFEDSSQHKLLSQSVLVKARWVHCETANFQCTYPKEWAGLRDISPGH